MTPNSTCPVCGYHHPSEPSGASPDSCARCGAMLVELDAPSTVEKVNVAETRFSLLGDRLIDLGPPVAWGSVYAIGFGIGAGLVALLLLPLLGLGIASGVPAAAYFGALVGALFGFLWKALEDVERKRVWGLLLGAAVGFIAGLLNFLVLRVGGYLPEVSPYEHVLVAFFAGSVGGTFIGSFKAED